MNYHHTKWIAANVEIPVFAKDFPAGKTEKAILYITACGIYEAVLNNQRVSDDLLRPGWTNYRKRIQYQEYDVTDLIRENNRIEITAAPGWYCGYLNGEGKNHHYGDRIAVCAELHLHCDDGSEEIIASDETWTCGSGAVRYAELYHGETIDYTAETSADGPVEIIELPWPAALVPQTGPSVKIVRRFSPLSRFITPKGELVYDFGQNIAGFTELKIKGQRGQRIIVRHAEMLDREGNFYTVNLRTAKATDTFICSGEDDVFMPRFTFHGFRYIAVEGLNETDAAEFTACAISSAIEQTAEFHCSNDLVNRLWSNINWSMRDNFVDIPTDCPQRDERLGWTGDAAIFANTAGQLYSTYDFFRKWLLDLASEQSVRFGLPDTVPNILMPPETPSGGSAVWGDACTLVPWSQYRLYGDPLVLSAQYDSMKNWVEFIRRTETPDHLHKSGHQRGDWLAMDREEGKGMSGSTDPYLISTAFYAESTRILSESAKILGKDEDAKEYGELYRKILEGFRKEFITPNGRVVSETQTALSLILCLGLAEKKDESTILNTLCDNLTKRRNKITTGFIGTPYLVKALSHFGRHDIAVKVFLNEEYPGWLNEVKLGATTIWERWDSMHEDGTFDESGMNSFNHYSFGAVGSWMIEELAGIEALEPGYKTIAFHPQPAYGLTEVSASRITPYGKAECAWTCRDGKITVRIRVPEGTRAKLKLPEQEGILKLGAGEYEYSYGTETVTEPQKYTMESTIRELSANPLFIEGIEQIMPGAGKNLSMDFLQNRTLNEMCSMMPSGAGNMFAMILKKMNMQEN